MKFRHRLIFSVCLALLSGTYLSTPLLAQKGDVAALSAKINELGRARSAKPPRGEIFNCASQHFSLRQGSNGWSRNHDSKSSKSAAASD
jgi:hypothetical protein